jgi:hypothetical protein
LRLSPGLSIETMLNDLAVEPGAALGQERIYGVRGPDTDIGRRRSRLTRGEASLTNV